MASDIKPTAPGIAEIRFLEWATLYSLRLTHEWIKRAVEKQADAAAAVSNKEGERGGAA